MQIDDIYRAHWRLAGLSLLPDAVAMCADSEMGPRNLPQCWHDCGQILTLFACKDDKIRMHIVWNRNCNQPRFDFVDSIRHLYRVQRG